jgi:4-diphosphocytidyl-2-C-methyl-D-erythritol kinase
MRSILINHLKIESPAKINLFLQVVGRRSDGYHELASLFQVVSLCDTLYFTLEDQDRLTCTDCSIPTDGSNLVYKAINLFRNKIGRSFGVKAQIFKKIPAQSGLGGGSSNAASTLWALNQMFGIPFSTETLQEWSAELGSDVPFFFSHGTAYCTGRGEKVQSINALNPQTIWIIKPEQGLSTPEVFKNLNPDSSIFRTNFDSQDSLKKIVQGENIFFNDLEESAFSLYPQLRLLKTQMLDAGFRKVLLAGSGSALICFGNIVPPALPNTQNYSVSFLNRCSNKWYELS